VVYYIYTKKTKERKRDKQMKKILLGTSIEDGKLYLTKHSWDCGWYWGFGYIGNANLHTHFDGTFLNGENIWKSPKELFKSTAITDKLWWELKDLFVQAYALKKVAEVYHYGGHCTITENTKAILSTEKEAIINADLEIILNKIWEVASSIEDIE